MIIGLLPMEIQRTRENYQSLDNNYHFVQRQGQTAISALAIEYSLGFVPWTALQTLNERKDKCE